MSATAPGDVPEPAPLITESMKKAAVIWVSGLPGQPAGRDLALWCAWLTDALYVVTGPGEQRAPGLAEASGCRVTGRGDSGGRIVTWPAVVTRVAPGGTDWDRVVPALVAKRLNLPKEDTAARWAAQCTVSRLAPAGEPDALPSGRLSAAPAGSDAAHRTAAPLRLPGVRGQRQRG